MAFPFGSLFGRNEPLWEVRGIDISMREPDFEPLSLFALPSRVPGNIKVGVYKNQMKDQWIDPKMHVVWDTVLQKCSSYSGKSALRASSFLYCVFYHLRHGRQKK